MRTRKKSPHWHRQQQQVQMMTRLVVLLPDGRAGQKAVKTISTKDVSNFKLRKGMPIGARVTLRRERMYEFLDRLIAISLPRTRDFQGVKAKGFDGRGNFTFGVKEQVIFPEISLDEVKFFNGMDITIVTSANTDEEAQALLEGFGFPFKK